MEPPNVQLNEVVISVISSVRETLGPHIGLSSSMARDLSEIRADPDQLREAILGIAAEAREAMKEGGRFVIETRNVTLLEHHSEAHQSQYVQLTISCSAINPPAALALVPPPVCALVTQAGGHVSSVGNGTTVNLYFPAAI